MSRSSERVKTVPVRLLDCDVARPDQCGVKGPNKERTQVQRQTRKLLSKERREDAANGNPLEIAREKRRKFVSSENTKSEYGVLHSFGSVSKRRTWDFENCENRLTFAQVKSTSFSIKRRQIPYPIFTCSHILFFFS